MAGLEQDDAFLGQDFSSRHAPLQVVTGRADAEVLGLRGMELHRRRASVGLEPISQERPPRASIGTAHHPCAERLGRLDTWLPPVAAASPHVAGRHLGVSDPRLPDPVSRRVTPDAGVECSGRGEGCQTAAGQGGSPLTVRLWVGRDEARASVDRLERDESSQRVCPMKEAFTLVGDCGEPWRELTRLHVRLISRRHLGKGLSRQLMK